MEVRIEPLQNVRELAEFIGRLNNTPSKHVGFCGEEKEEIYQTLLQNFSDFELSQSFSVAYQGDQIIGAMGLDIDKEDKSAEVWGPFLDCVPDHETIANQLLKNVITYSPVLLKNLHFFLNRENIEGKEFVLNHDGVEKGQHLILKATNDAIIEVNCSGIERYNSAFEAIFSELHTTEFPDTYYSAQVILERLSEKNQLFLITDDEKLVKGYVYLETSPEHGVGSIEYIAVSSTYRKQGVGTTLIKFALKQIFSFDSIKEISLSVNKGNEKAIHLYKAAGFREKYELVHYVLNFSGDTRW